MIYFFEKETLQIQDEGFLEYIFDIWNFNDFVGFILYFVFAIIRVVEMNNDVAIIHDYEVNNLDEYNDHINRIGITLKVFAIIIFS